MGRCCLSLLESFKFSIFVWVLISARIDAARVSDSDKSALLEFKATLSDPDGVLRGWDVNSENHCFWTGVTCGAGARVVAVNLPGGGNSLSCVRIARFPIYGFGIRRPCTGSTGRLLGKLSAAVAKLTELRILSLPFNELSGEIPGEIWGMEKLEVLDLEGNLISGSLPLRFGGLTNLRVLNLGFNQIFGRIPKSLLNCRGLEILNLSGNRIKGSIPRFVGGFKGLSGLYLSFNQLSGLIPVEIVDGCGKLEYLELAGNFLTGGIPGNLGNCKGLRTLLLYSNMFEEVIPSELGQLSQLEVLDVSRNNLGGSVPPAIASCTKLSVLVLSNLWEPLLNVSNLGDGNSHQHLAFTSDEFNFYEGSIPARIFGLSSLRML